VGTVSCDCRRTRTTSSGVTVGVSIFMRCSGTHMNTSYLRFRNALGKLIYTPNNEVRMLPDTADNIFCPSDTSPRPALWSASSARCVAVAISPFCRKVAVSPRIGTRCAVYTQGTRKGRRWHRLETFSVVTKVTGNEVRAV